MGPNYADGRVWITSSSAFAVPGRAQYVHCVSRLWTGSVIAIFVSVPALTRVLGGHDRNSLRHNWFGKEHVVHNFLVAVGPDNLDGRRNCSRTCLRGRSIGEEPINLRSPGSNIMKVKQPNSQRVEGKRPYPPFPASFL